jgi:nitrite reductase/ring-hydroxylating ferredoxin subunit
MKNFFLLILATTLLLGCGNDTVRNNNPYIPSYGFSYVINLNLNSALTSPLNPVSITEPSGISMIVIKVSNTDYRAWNANCPNQTPSSCSRLIPNSLKAKCSCENYEYNLLTGIGNAQYTLIPYRVEVLGNTSIRVYN